MALTCGASPALLLALISSFDPGDRVALARPGYVAYRNTLRALHMTPVEIACGADSRFQLTAAHLAAMRDGAILANAASFLFSAALLRLTLRDYPNSGEAGRASLLRDSLRGHDLISRYGGEEFALAFPDCSSVDATRALNTVAAQLDAAITVGGLPKFTSSFGITEIEPGEELAAALRRADDALLVAKRSGRNRVEIRDDSLCATA